MTYLLMVLLIAVLILSLLFSLGDILSPWVIMCSVFIFSTSIVIFNSFKWGTDYKASTIVVIICSLICFGIGELISRLWVESRYSNSIMENTNTVTNRNIETINISNEYMFMILIVMTMIVIFDVRSTQRVANSIGSVGDIGDFMENARYALVTEGMYKGIVSRLVVINKAFAYIFGYVLLYNKVLVGSKKNRLVYFCPIFLFAINAIVSTGRTELLQYSIYFCVLFAMMYKLKTNWSNKGTVKIISILIIAVIIFLVLFLLLGRISGKGSYNSSLEYISYYGGSSIILLDKYMDNPVRNSDGFGANTLYGIYNMLRSIGFDFPKRNITLEMTYIPHFYSNIYTSFRRYIQDFGFFGLFFIQTLLGMFYGGMYHKIKQKNDRGLSLIIYCSLIFPIVESSIEERFMTKILTSTTFLWILLVVIFYKVLVQIKTESNYNAKLQREVKL